MPVLIGVPSAIAISDDADRSGPDLVVDEEYVVDDLRTRGDVLVTSTGTLRIVSGGTLLAEGLTLEDGSRLLIEGGTMAVMSNEGDRHAIVTGTCLELVMTGGAVLVVEGGPGEKTMEGGDALVQLEARARVHIEDSVVLVSGGDGHSTDAQVVVGDLAGDEFGGGDASLSIQIDPMGTGLRVVDSSVEVVGGNGGDAPDGGPSIGAVGGSAGGFTAGGSVSGRVAVGGTPSLMFQASLVQVLSSLVEVVGGDGGDAGDGGDSTGTGGGGGGGYSGGGGDNWSIGGGGGDGGPVSGMVAKGGDAALTMKALLSLDVSDSRMVVEAGDGGHAGDGGDCDMTRSDNSLGGAGGGGYSGGGGGGAGELSGNDGGRGGTVTGRVGTGGDSTLLLQAPDAMLLGSKLSSTGGTGGRAGTAGTSTRDDGDWDWRAGGGGGSYSAGGGAGVPEATWSSGNGGEAGEVSRLVGAGGNALLDLDLSVPTIPENTSLHAYEGRGGVCWRSDAPGPSGGHGEGLITADGYTSERIPMARVALLAPDDGVVSSKIPTFRWAKAHPASAAGAVVNYEIQMDDDPDFGSPEMKFNINANFMRPGWLPDFTNYWRVRALYERPWNSPGPWSVPWAVTYINLPPVIADIPIFDILVSQVTEVDLSGYISDPDDTVGQLSIMSDHPNVIGVSHLNLSLHFPEELGTIPINFTVADTLNSVEGQFMVRVSRYRHSPYILGLTNHKPPLELKLYEGTVAWYDIKVHDVDSDKFTYWTTGSWEGTKAFSNGTLRVTGGRGDVGSHEFYIKVADEGGREATMKVSVDVLNVNDPPDPPSIVSPSKRVTVREGDVVSFTALVSDPDLRYGQVLNVTFISNDSGVMRMVQTTTTAAMSSSSLAVGQHVVTVVVSDGQYSASDQVVVIVEATPEPPPVTPPQRDGPSMWVYIVVSVVLFAVGFTAGNMQLRRRLRKGPEEVD